ncbi:hypothetical protein Tco_0313470 [Tanacetum coccineum]
MEVETPYELLKDDQKKQLGKNNEAKMTVYNALRRKEYEQVFMCKTAKEKFSISDEETIDNGFTRFNAIVTSLKSLDQDYSSKNHVRKFLHALPLKWRAKVTAIEEAKDLATFPLDELIVNLMVYEMILENDGIASKTTKEKVQSLAHKAKVTKEQTSDDSDSQGGSDEDVDEAFNLMARYFRKFFQRVIDLDVEIDLAMVEIGSEEAAEIVASEDDNEPQNDATCLMVIDSQEVQSKPSISNNNVDLLELQKENGELLKFSKDFSKTYEKLLQEKCNLEKEHSKLFSKVNELKL